MSQRIVKSYRVLIGMEVHVQLAAQTKLTGGCPSSATHFGAPPNSLVDAGTLGLPGVLPVLNRRAIELAIMAGLALNCQISRRCRWDRKSYFYPDLPAGYQLSQLEPPLCYGGSLTVDGQAIRIRRAHLEEDAGKLLHEAPGGYPIDYTIVDLNRAGTALVEIVTEPDLCDGAQVAAFSQALQKIIQFSGAGDGQMQLGHMRFEPNVNLHITDSDGVVHKTGISEIKNLNSFVALQKATDYEIQRQLDLWVQTGELGRKSTFGWDDAAQSTILQRQKETAQEYRYFPDPDLLPVAISDEWLDAIKAQLGEQPDVRRARYIKDYSLSEADAVTLTSDRAIGDFYEQVIAHKADSKRAANLILSHGLRIAREQDKPLVETGLTPQGFAQVAILIDASELAASSAAPVFDAMLKSPAKSASELVDALHLRQVSDHSAIDSAIDQIIAANPQPVADYQSGKQAALGALTGLVMRSAKGLNPKLVQQRLREKLSQ